MREVTRISLCGTMLGLLACGGGDDPPPIDDPPQPGEATVTIELNGTAQEGILVAFNNPDGSFNTSGETNANGQVGAVIEYGSIVTVAPMPAPLTGIPVSNMLQTIYGVNPGDTIVVDPLAIPVAGSDVLTGADVTVPAAFDGAASYYFLSNCYEGTVNAAQVVEFDVDEGCVGADGKFDVIVFARDGGGNDIAFSLKKNVTPINGTTAVTLPNWSTTFHDYDLTMSNIPPGIVNAMGVVIPLVDTYQADYHYLSFFEPTPVHQAANWPDKTLLQYAAQYSQNDASIRILGTAPIIDDFDLDIAANVPGRVVGTSVNTTNGVRRPGVEIFTTGGFDNIDGMVSCVGWVTPKVGLNPDSMWWFVVPPGTTSFVAPDLPSSFNAYLPNEDVLFMGQPTVNMLGDSAIEGYDVFRNTVNTQGMTLIPVLSNLSAIELVDLVVYGVEGGCPTLL